MNKQNKCLDCGNLIYNTSIRCRLCANKAKKGKHFSPETEIKKRQHLSPNTEFTSEGVKGKNSPRYGVKLSVETKLKISQKNKGKHLSFKTEFKKGQIPWNKGVPRSEETKEKLRKANLGKKYLQTINIKKGLKLEKNPSWKGGKSFEPYGLEFNSKLKEGIRKRDNCICQECHHTQKQLGYKLSIHHIDFNKKNNSPLNLISLCKSCHSQTNYNRENWTEYFKDKIKGEIN